MSLRPARGSWGFCEVPGSRAVRAGGTPAGPSFHATLPGSERPDGKGRLPRASPELKALARPRGHIQIILCSCAAQRTSDRCRQQAPSTARAPGGQGWGAALTHLHMSGRRTEVPLPPTLPGRCLAPLHTISQEPRPGGAPPSGNSPSGKGDLRGHQNRGRENREVGAPAQRGHMSLHLSAHGPGRRYEGTGRTSHERDHLCHTQQCDF